MPAPKGNNFAAGNSGGAPEGNSNALGNDGGPPEGNSNAMTHGRYMTPEARRESFTDEERAMHATLTNSFRERFPEYSEERARELATIQVMHTRLTVESLATGFGGESFDHLMMDALRAYARDLRETEERAQAEAWERKMDLLMGRGAGGSEEDIDPDRLPTPEEPASAEIANAPGPRRAVANGGGEVSEERASPADEGEEGEGDETDEDANTRVSRRVGYAQLNRGRGR